jgi:hypothetical protein
MPRPRTPLALAITSGQARKNPQRFRTRREPPTTELGQPPAWMDAPRRAAWATFARELPWLRESDRALLEIACTLRARMTAGEVLSVNALALLRQCLGQMGATPADRTKVVIPAEPEADPADEYFQ